jgi:hypothetical protein
MELVWMAWCWRISLFAVAKKLDIYFVFGFIWVVSLCMLGFFVYRTSISWVWEVGFLREDSRFFLVPPPSFADLLVWFSTPQNSMAQYRPTTKLLWALPQSFGLRDPNHFRIFSFLLLVTNGVLLGWILHRFTQKKLLAFTLAWAYLLHPLHTKPLYWISAWHNSAVVTFGLLAFVFRFLWLEKIRNGVRRAWWIPFGFYISWILAIGSRESGLLLALPFLALDQQLREWWKRNWGIVLVGLFFFLFLYVWNRPLERLQPQKDSLFNLSAMAHTYWDYARALVFSTHEWSRESTLKGFWISLGASVVTLTLISSLFVPKIWPFVALAGAGLGLHLLYRLNWQVEYMALFAASFFLCFGYWLSRIWNPLALFCGFMLVALSIISNQYSKQMFASGILSESEAVREYFRAIDRLDKILPPHQPVRFVESESLLGHPIERTFHLLPQALQYFYPHRTWRWETSATPGEIGLHQWIVPKALRKPGEALVRFRSYDFEVVK